MSEAHSSDAKDVFDEQFDFARHEQKSVAAYLQVEQFYKDLASVTARIISECLKHAEISVHSVDFRAKEPASLGRKAAIPSESNPNIPKYKKPLEEITDLAGVRVITYFPSTLDVVDIVIRSEFDVIEFSNKGEILIVQDKFGYQSIHYLVKINSKREGLSEYQRYKGKIVEIQVRTILQHAWAEIEHDIQYKSSFSIPKEIRRRFHALAGMLEIADREFQSIQEVDKSLSDQADTNVQSGNLEFVEITPKSLNAYLDRRLGPDGRMTDWSYDWTTRLLKRLGFTSLDQVEDAISEYDDRELSYLAEGSQVGQINRFEAMLLAALGDKYLERHSWASEPWFRSRRERVLNKFTAQGIPVGTYDPIDSMVEE